MADKIFFSVIIPSLNEEKYLPTLLSSLSKQSFRNFELILIDGKSDDKTVAIFNKYKPLIPNATLIISDRRNVGYQRNIGGDKAIGQYLIFLDADVDIGQTFLEEIHIGAIKRKFPFATTWIMPDSQEPVDEMMMTIANLGMEIAKVINKPYVGGYNTIVTKDFFIKMKGFREDIKIGEDHNFAMRAGKIGVLPFIFKEPYVVWSLRRFRSEGKLKVIRKLAQSAVYTILKGPITKELFDYRMGGHVHTKKTKKKVNLTKLDTYLHAINKLDKKLNSLLS